MQQFSEVGGGDKCVGDLMDSAQAVIYFPFDMSSMILCGRSGRDDPEMYINVHAVRC